MNIYKIKKTIETTLGFSTNMLMAFIVSYFICSLKMCVLTEVISYGIIISFVLNIILVILVYKNNKK